MNAVKTKAGISVRIKPGRTRRLPGFVNIGTTLLLALLLLLTLVVLALLCLSGAKNDLEFSRNLARQREEYYDACSRSEEILSRVDQVLRDAEEKKTAPDFSGLPVRLEAGSVSWQISAGENRMLCGAVSAETGTLIRWQIIPAGPWNGEDTIKIP